MVDYSKWNDFADSSEEEEEEEEDISLPIAKPSSSSSSSSKGTSAIVSPESMAEFYLEGLCQYRTPSYVQFAPGDTGLGLHPIFYTHPKDHVPEKVPHPFDPKKKVVYDKWGIVYEDDGQFEAMKRTMQTQFLYMKGPEIPEIQFVEFLEKKYLKKIKDHRKKNPDCIQRDLVLTVYLMRGWDWNEKKKESIFLGPPWEVFRKIRVSSNMVVRIFVDKILIPVIGFRRNYHAYAFIDTDTGVPYGPTKSNAVDFLHWAKMHFFKLSDDAEVRVGDILKDKDSSAHFVYDLGDMWQFFISVDEVVPVEQSNGKVILLEGAGNAPPEDSNGLDGNKGSFHFYQLYDEFTKLKKAGKKPTRKMMGQLREAATACNFSSQRMGGKVKASNIKNLPYDPTYFDFEGAEFRLKEAIKSHVSVDGGEMKLHYQLSNGSMTDNAMAKQMKGKGDLVTTLMDGRSCMQEVLPDKGAAEEPQRLALCGSCGAPAKFKCSRCNKIRYCTKECQRRDWRSHKSVCK